MSYSKLLAYYEYINLLNVLISARSMRSTLEVDIKLLRLNNSGSGHVKDMTSIRTSENNYALYSTIGVIIERVTIGILRSLDLINCIHC